MKDWKHTKYIIKAVLTSVGYIVIASVLVGCKSTQTSTTNEHTEQETITIVSTSNDSTAHLRRELDSLRHSTMRMDSLVQILKEKEKERKVTESKYYQTLRDSMAIHIDSLGNWTYHYWTWSEKREEIHDTLWRDRVIESDTRRISILRDSISMWREIADSLSRISAMRDSIYHELKDSILLEQRIVEEQKKSVVQRATDGMATIIIMLVAIAAITACVKWALKK